MSQNAKEYFKCGIMWAYRLPV